MDFNPIRTRLCLVRLAVLVLLTLPSFAHAQQQGLLPLELRPYRVVLFVAADVPQHSIAPHENWLESIQQTATRCVGAQWNLTVRSVDWLQPISAEGLTRLTAESLVQRSSAKRDDFDVWLVAAVRSSGSGFRVDVRGWQPAIGVDAGLAGSDVYDWRDVPVTLVKSGYASFRPVGLVEDVDGTQVRVLIQGSALAVSDPAFAASRESQVFTPLLAGRNREQVIERLQQIPWTYLTAGATQGHRLQCDLQSGLRSPIGGKQRGRVETLAVTVIPVSAVTELELTTQSRPSLPLAGHRIELRDSADIPPADASGGKDDHLIQRILTDRRGRVSIPASRGQVIWLFAYSGSHLLARVPILPGVQPELRLEVPDDSSRLETEAELHMFQGQLVEAVAARNTAAARIRAAIKKNDKSLARAAEAELRKQPDAQVFLTQLLAIRVPAVKGAKTRRDRAGEARINRMCDEMAVLIQQYLGEDKRKVVLEELKAMEEVEGE